MIIAVYAVHMLVCMALIVIVLLQTGKGSDMGAAFGGASQTVFGSGGRQTFLSRLTAGAAVVFMITCLFLAWYSSKTVSRGVMKDYHETPVGAQLPPGAPEPAGAPPPAPAGEPAAPTPAEAGKATAPPGPTGPETGPAPAGPGAPTAPAKPAPPSGPPQLP